MKKKVCSVLMAGVMICALLIGKAPTAKAAYYDCCPTSHIVNVYDYEQDYMYSHMTYCSTHQQMEECAIVSLNTYKVVKCTSCGTEFSRTFISSKTFHQLLH